MTPLVPDLNQTPAQILARAHNWNIRRIRSMQAQLVGLLQSPLEPTRGTKALVERLQLLLKVLLRENDNAWMETKLQAEVHQVTTTPRPNLEPSP